MGFFAFCVALPSFANAAAVVLQNQTAENVKFSIHWTASQESQHELLAGDVRPIAVTAPVDISYTSAGQPRRHPLLPNSIYIFVPHDGSLQLTELDLPGRRVRDSRRVSVSSSSRQEPADGVCSIPVKILVDDKEPTVQAVWEKRLRDRLNDASDIFERCCRVRFKVVAVDTWVAEPGIHDFDQSAAEFERKVPLGPGPARLAIGFTGHYEWEVGEKHIGGIRGPLRTHILIREALVRVSEPERLELLVHELGHFLGAVHSSDGTSVMRPALGDRQSCAKGFRIGFDAPNTLAMYLIGEELRTRPIRGLNELPPETKQPLRSVYAWLARSTPDDNSAMKFGILLDIPFPEHR